MKLAPWIQTLLGIDMKIGDPIYYYNKNGDCLPGEVLKITTRVKIRINDVNGDREIWAKKNHVELQSDNP